MKLSISYDELEYYFPDTIGDSVYIYKNKNKMDDTGNIMIEIIPMDKETLEINANINKDNAKFKEYEGLRWKIVDAEVPHYTCNEWIYLWYHKKDKFAKWRKAKGFVSFE